MPDRLAIPGIVADNDFVVPADSCRMLALRAAASKLAELEGPLLIIGEPGTGKRTLAQQIHDASPRRHEPFRVVDCLQFSAKLAAGEAVQALLGAHGMVFFRNAAQANLPAQQKILGMIQRGQRAPRVVVASHEDLDHGLRARRISEEFYDVISLVRLRVPPLRARREEILPLAEYFLHHYSRAFGRPKPIPSPDAVEFLQSYRWPGNIAELETAMKSLVAINDEKLVLAALRASAWTTGRAEGPHSASLKQATRAASLEVERELISDVLAATGWNRKRAAQQLQISYKALLYKLKRIGIESPPLQRTMESREL